MINLGARFLDTFRYFLILLCVVFMELAGTSLGFAEIALLRPKKDSTLIESANGNLANGSGPAVFAGRNSSGSDFLRRALLGFDLSAAIPPGSSVTKAVLSLNLTATNAGPVSVRLHRLAADWGEGASVSSGGGGATPTRGDATWIHRFYDDAFWVHPGGDFEAAPSAVTLVDQPGPYTWGSTQEMVADVQAWVDHPETAFGWILVGDESLPTTVKRFDSRESPDEANRPLLYVEFVPPCSPAPIGPGAWQQQCADLLGEREAFPPGSADAGLIEPRFAEWVIPCTQWLLTDLGLPEANPCEALAWDLPRSCQERAARKLTVLVMNVCAGLLQTSCPIDAADDGCVSTNVGDLLREIAPLINSEDCRRASGCAGILD